MNETMNNTRKEQPLPGAEVKPSDFPLCSVESRAAVRALAERKSKPKRIIQIRFVSPDGTATDGPRFVLDE
jgi:hypothetical protein